MCLPVHCFCRGPEMNVLLTEVSLYVPERGTWAPLATCWPTGICLLISVCFLVYDFVLYCFSLHGCTTFSMFVFYLMIRHIITGISSQVVCHGLFLCLGERSHILPVLRMQSLISVIGMENVRFGENGEHLGSLTLK